VKTADPRPGGHTTGHGADIDRRETMKLMHLLNPISHYWFWRSFLGDLRYLSKTGAPCDVMIGYTKGRFLNKRVARPYLQAQREFQSHLPSLRLSKDWFSDKAAQWLSVFEAYGLTSRPKVEALEIGSWEGLSSFFILRTLPGAHLTCVDTWEGADEHKAGVSATKEILSRIEESFDANLSPYRDRLTKYKGTSFSYFNEHAARNIFDLIYVDGSHHCDDVIVDAVKCFEMLKPGGVMFFDDYFWRHYPKAIDNPAAAINAFLRLKQGEYKIVRIYSQVVIEKVSHLTR
jgi:predicted O-methyltransferase YrrM